MSEGGVVFECIRRPSIRFANEIIQQELVKGFNSLIPNMKKDLLTMIPDWKQLPEFVDIIDVSRTVISVRIAVDTRTKIGQIYMWVNSGTGVEGPRGQSYEIFPVNTDMLVFNVPYQPKTVPPDGLTYNPDESIHTVKTDHVMHPGIRPRRFSTRALAKYRGRDRGSFFRVIENAYKRAYRRMK